MINNYKSNNTKNPINIIFLSKISKFYIKEYWRNGKKWNCKKYCNQQKFKTFINGYNN